MQTLNATLNFFLNNNNNNNNNNKTRQKRKMRIAQNVDPVEELVLSQENARALTNNWSDSRDWNSRNVSA